MADERVERRLATILAADVVGYSRLMGENEIATLRTLKGHRELISRSVESHMGRVFGCAGDSVNAEFASPVEAVLCATEFQREIDLRNAGLPRERHMRFRVGVNLGDVLVDGNDLFGDGVNVAARLEGLARPGGICISDTVASHIRDRLSLQLEDLGQHLVKNIRRPVRVYRVILESEFRESSPFRGLDVFEYEHADLFHGRSHATRLTCARLEKQATDGTAFLLIYGMSGAGKSSLVRAGLLPEITRPGNKAGINRYCVFQPSDGPDPLSALVNALCAETALPNLADVCGGSAVARRAFEDGDAAAKSIQKALGIASHSDADLPGQLAIAVDELDKIFTSEHVTQQQRESFVAVLGALARCGNVRVVATIRTDLLHHCASIPELSELKDGLGSYELLPPSGPEIAQIICEPARTAGLRFDRDPERGRLEDVLQDTASRNPASLPLLQFVLDALYESGRDRRILTFADYDRLGGLEGAIANRADEVVGALPEEMQKVLPSVLRSLVTIRLRDEAVATRAVPKAEIANTPETSALVDALVGARLLVSDHGGDGEVVIRVAHEALLSHWPSAQGVVAAAREFLGIRARVQADTRRWLAEDRSSDLLLPSGRRLIEAREMLESRGAEVESGVAEYIEASVSAQRERQAAEQRRRDAEEAIKREALEIEAAAATHLARRTRAAALVALLLAAIAGAGAALGLKGQTEATRQAELARESAAKAIIAEQEAERQAISATTARDEAQVQLRRAQIEQARFRASKAAALVDEGDAGAAIALALSAMPLENPQGWPDPHDIIEVPLVLTDALLRRRESSVLRGHLNAVWTASFSPDSEHAVTASADGTARIWNVSDGIEIAILQGHEGTIQSASFSSDGRRIVTASWDDTARLWDAKVGTEIGVLQGHDSWINSARFSPDGSRVVTTSLDHTARLWSTDGGTEIAVLRGHEAAVQSAEFSHDGTRIVTGSLDGTLRLWSAGSGVELATLGGHSGHINYALFSPDDTTVLSASSDHSARLWDAATGKEIAVLSGHEGTIRSADFSPDGALAVTGSSDRTARLWDTKSGLEIAVLDGHEDAVVSVSFSPDGKQVLTASWDRSARLWDIARKTEVAVLRGHENWIHSAAFSADGNQVVTASQDHTARLWNARSGSVIAVLSGHDERIQSAVFSRRGDRLVTASWDDTARVWDAASGEQIAVLRGHQGSIQFSAFSPNGLTVVTAAQDATARVWDAESGDLTAVLTGHDSAILAASFSPDGAQIATTSLDGTARIWDAVHGREITVLEGHGGAVHSVAYSPDGSRILTASDDDTARLWDIETGAEITVLRGHGAVVRSARFSPDGSRVVTGSWDKTARLWDPANGAEIAVLEGHAGTVQSAAFSPDGMQIVTASADGTARTWDAANGTALSVFRGHGGPVHSAVFSPDANHILTASSDTTARLWDVAINSEIAVLNGHLDEVHTAVFSPNGKRIVTASWDGTARLWPHYRNMKELSEHARDIVDLLMPLTQSEKCAYHLADSACDAEQ